MGKWITTGQLIDSLNIGEIAEVDGLSNNETHGHVTKTYRGIEWCNSEGKGLIGESYLQMGGGAFGFKWRILPKPVGFDEAMKAKLEGKKVNFHPQDYKTIEVNSDVSLSKTRLADYSLNELFISKFTIEGDNL